jgi:hypothetical protein
MRMAAVTALMPVEVIRPRTAPPLLGLAVVGLVVGVGVTQRAQARRRGPGEGIAAGEVDVVVPERGEPGGQFVGDGEAVGGELLDGGAVGDEPEQAQGFEDPPVVGERVAQPGRFAVQESMRIRL